MGLHNRITKEKFEEIKKQTTKPADDRKLAKKLKVSETTVRNIRISKDYQQHCEKVFRYHGNPSRRRYVTYRDCEDEPWRKLESIEKGPKSDNLWILWVSLPVLIAFTLLMAALLMVGILFLGGK